MNGKIDRIDSAVMRGKPEEMMTAKEVAEFFKTSVHQAKRLFEQYPSVRVGRQRRMRRSTLERILQREV
jgi:hypothetical protein